MVKNVNIVDTPAAKEALNLWEKTVAQAKKIFSNPYNFREGGRTRDVILANVRSTLETAIQIRVTEIVQKNPTLPTQTLESLVALACDSLDKIIQEVLDPYQRRNENIKDLIREANKKMEEIVKALKEIPLARVRWDALMMKANQGKKFNVHEDKVYMKIAQHAFYSYVDDVYDRATKNGAVSKDTFFAAVDKAWEEIERKHQEILKNTNVNNRTKAMCLDGIMCEKISAIESVFTQGQVQEGEVGPKLLKSGNNGYTLIRPVQIENIVLQGGGAKGVGYIGALKNMFKGGIFSNLKRVAGSSAGALTATALSCGVSTEQLEAVGLRVQKASIEKMSNLRLEYPGLLNKFIWGIAFFGKASGVVCEVDKIAHNNVKDFLDQVLPEDLGILTTKERERISILQEPFGSRVRLPEDGSSEPCPMVTFQDLIMLRKLPGGPEIFKELTITGWNASFKRTEYFNADNSPEMPIALAARVSMALPFAFNGLRLDTSKYTPDILMSSRKVRLYDGGVGSNLPSEIFIRTNKSQVNQEAAQAATLSFILDNQGESMCGISRYRGFGSSWVNKILSFILGISSITGLFTNSYEELTNAEARKKNKLGNIMVVSHGEIGTTDIELDENVRRSAVLMSELGTAQWIEQHRNEGYSVHCSSVVEAAGLLSMKELQSVIQDLGQKPADQLSQIEAAFLAVCQTELHDRAA